jgi:hypothetical protein
VTWFLSRKAGITISKNQIADIIWSWSCSNRWRNDCSSNGCLDTFEREIITDLRSVRPRKQCVKGRRFPHQPYKHHCFAPARMIAETLPPRSRANSVCGRVSTCVRTVFLSGRFGTLSCCQGHICDGFSIVAKKRISRFLSLLWLLSRRSLWSASGSHDPRCSSVRLSRRGSPSRANDSRTPSQGHGRHRSINWPECETGSDSGGLVGRSFRAPVSGPMAPTPHRV